MLHVTASDETHQGNMMEKAICLAHKPFDCCENGQTAESCGFPVASVAAPHLVTEM